MFVLKKSFYTVLFIVLWQSLSSQVSVIVPIVKPSANYGYVFKPGLGLELRYVSQDFDEKLQYGVSIGIFGAKPRQEVFHEYIIESSSTTSIYPKDNVYSHFYSVMFGIYTEYKLIDGDISPFVGIDGLANGTHYRYGDPQNYSTDGSLFVGLFPKVGAYYKLSDQLVLLGGIGKYMSIDIEGAVFAYWKTFIGINYYY